MKHLFIALLILCLPLIASADFDWTSHTLLSWLESPAWCYVADLDQDGNLDYILSEAFSLTRFMNDGDMHFGNFPITTGPFQYAISFATGDMDGDGDIDIVTGGAPEIDLWINDGDMNYTEQIIVPTGRYYVECRVADLDSDGDLDILEAGSGGTIVQWFENLGELNFTPHTIESGSVNPRLFPDLADYDGDGDMDLLIGYQNESVFSILLNDGAGNFTLDATYPSPYGIINDACFADVNGDGEYDIAGSAGGFAFWIDIADNATSHDIVEFSSLLSLYAGDIDGDGHIDFATDHHWDYDYHAYENLDGDGSTWIETELAGETYNDRPRLNLVDFDGDGDLDVVTTNCEPYGNGYVLWFEYTGDPGSVDPVEVLLTPATDPVIVPQGGQFTFDLTIRYNLDDPVYATIWSEAMLPNGNLYGPINQVRMLFSPNQFIELNNLSQDVPSFAPLGNYSFQVNVGPGLAYPVATDSFPFVVTETQMNHQYPSRSEWSSDLSGRIRHSVTSQTATGDDRTLPANFAITTVYPNPFNAATTLTVTLPEAADLTLTVHNTLGQQVAELAGGQYAAGQHTFTFDGSTLASGIYFVHASVPGELNTVRKILLMK